MSIEKRASRLVFITGGTGSIGKALVKAFSENGDSVVFQFCNRKEIANELETTYTAKGVQIDLSENFIPPDYSFDIIINNAGINIINVISHEVELSQWNKTLAVNLTAPFIICKAYLPSMVKNRWGRIINISSIYGLRGVDWNLPYNVSKHGISGLTKSIAKDYGAQGITCNEICPGPVNSEMMQRIGSEEAQSQGLSTEEYLKEYAKQIPAKRLAEPWEISSLALFVASPSADYLNGVSLPLDGGWIA